MSQSTNRIDFATILASSIHDMKNSLASIRGLITDISLKSNNATPEFSQLEIESNRMNNSLIQLLSLYKMEIEQFNVAIDEYAVEDMFADITANQSNLLKLNNISIDTEYEQHDDDLCFCDFDLITSALSTILNNAQRYANSKIILSTGIIDNYRYFSIEDDGRGFTEDLLVNNKQTDLNFYSGNTGLGLYFVAAIAKLHFTEDRFGYIQTSNESRLGGAKFSLFLP